MKAWSANRATDPGNGGLDLELGTSEDEPRRASSVSRDVERALSGVRLGKDVVPYGIWVVCGGDQRADKEVAWSCYMTNACITSIAGESR